MIEWIHELPGFKIGVNNINANVEFLLNPNEIPYEYPSFIVYSGKGNLGFAGMMAEFHLGEGISHNNKDVSQMTGDSFLLLEEQMETKLKIDQFMAIINLIPNEYGRLGKVLVNIPDIAESYDEKNKVMFRLINEVLNNLSFQYDIPLNFSSFCIMHNDFGFFTVIDKSPSQKKIIKEIGVNTPEDLEFWHIAMGNYRRACSSLNPSERFLSLFLGVEGIRATIKKILNLNYKKEDDEIIHQFYKEPIIKNEKLNTKEFIFDELDGKDFYYALYNKNSPLRNIRNESAHVVRRNERFRLNTDLDDYLSYQKSIMYLHHMFHVQLNELQVVQQKLSVL